MGKKPLQDSPSPPLLPACLSLPPLLFLNGSFLESGKFLPLERSGCWWSQGIQHQAGTMLWPAAGTVRSCCWGKCAGDKLSLFFLF